MQYIILITVSAAAVLAAVFTIIAKDMQMRKTMNLLSDMLEQGMNGCFSEKAYDESRLSSLEARFFRYLSACSATAMNITAEKDRVKALITDISHQTKTPIANILLYSQLLSEYELQPEAKDCVLQMSFQAEKLKFLIDSLVKLSRLETGIISVTPDINSVEELINSASQQVKSRAEEKQIEITINDISSTARFDMKWTCEAIYNILENAVKYTKPNRRIIISATPYELFYRIDISDEGIGMAEEELSKIFSRFYRSPSVSDQEGVGIGLFLAREIIVSQGGYIKVKSLIGKGSVFSVFLPK